MMTTIVSPTGMQPGNYFHGYSSAEQNRLIRQAEHWREQLIPIGISYQSGERVLEIGCAAGATLAVLSQLFPRVNFSGVDIEPTQIDFARTYLASCGVEVDLRIADGAKLPWQADSFDHVYIMWLLEHVKDSIPILQEAHRVLRVGGSITITEVDYTTFKMTPVLPDWEYLANAQYEFYARHGNPIAGRELGVLLQMANFADVRNAPVGFHFHHGTRELPKYVDYLTELLEPAIPKMESLGFDRCLLQSGLDCLRSVPDRANGSMTSIIYRAYGRKHASR